jgi:hypothetical protein
MFCCGQGRGRVAMNGKAASPAPRPRPVSSAVLYEYVGATGMSVIGPISGTQYRFAGPGAKVQIDRRDVGSMAGLPNLRRLE